MDRTLIEIAQEVNACIRCGLCRGRKHAVPGRGDSHAKVMLVGEAPGAQENQTGEPFVGRSGEFLDERLAMIQLSRADVFITNLVKCRPPGNRDPWEDEIAECWEYLRAQILAVEPRIIVALGRFAAHRLTGKQVPLEELRVTGKIIGYQFATAPGLDALVFPTYHPAACLRSPKWRQAFDEDMIDLKGLLDEIPQD